MEMILSPPKLVLAPDLDVVVDFDISQLCENVETI
jgi:hypothetical protein